MFFLDHLAHILFNMKLLEKLDSHLFLTIDDALLDINRRKNQKFDYKD